MSVNVTFRTLTATAPDAERAHRLRLTLAWVLAVALALSLVLYGYGYYSLSAHQRPLSPQHTLLRPSGAIGLRLGMLGTLLFLGIYLYPLRKRWAWLGRQGSSRHWLDFHVVLGIAAPVLITFHSSFKFHGIAGMAYWIMVAVAISGVVGRYLYAQIPRSLSAAEVSLKELQETQAKLTQQLAAQKLFSRADLWPLIALPTAQQVEQMSLLGALTALLAVDLQRPFHVAALRFRALGALGRLLSLGGLLRTTHLELERVIYTARKQAAVSKHIVFLSRTQRVFHLWHVVHRPFSYSFAFLASIHIVVVLLLGYR